MNRMIFRADCLHTALGRGLMGRELVSSVFDGWDICTEDVQGENLGPFQRVVLRSIPPPSKKARHEQ